MLSFYVWVANNVKRAFIMVITFGVIISLFIAFTDNKKDTINFQEQTEASRKVLYQTVNDPSLNKTQAGKTTLTIFRSFFCSTVGETCTENPKDGNKNYQTSLFGKVSGYISLPYLNPPASGTVWAYNGLQNAGFVPKTHAAGIGFQSIMSFNTIWKAFRNIVFVGMVFAIVILGFLIMFRVKIDPQTVVSIESALPRIVITLLLITFSFAIAGFLIDLTYLATLLVFQVFSSSGVQGFEAANLQHDYLNRIDGGGILSNFDNGFNVYWRGMQNLFYAMPGMIQGAIHVISNFLLLYIVYKVVNIVGPTAQGIMGNFQGNGEAGVIFASVGIAFNFATLIATVLGLFIGFAIAPFIYYLIILVIVLLGLLLLYFRIFFLLIGAYIQIVLHIILAPILIFPNVLPGNNSFTSWVKRLFGYLMVFPLTTFFLILSSFILTINDTTTLLGIANASSDHAGVIPPFTLPLMQGIDTTALGAVVGASILVMTPNLVKSTIKSLIGDGIEVGGAGALFGGVSASVGAGVNTFSRFATLAPHIREKGIGKVIAPFASMLGIKMGH